MKRMGSLPDCGVPTDVLKRFDGKNVEVRTFSGGSFIGVASVKVDKEHGWIDEFIVTNAKGETAAIAHGSIEWVQEREEAP